MPSDSNSSTIHKNHFYILFCSLLFVPLYLITEKAKEDEKNLHSDCSIMHEHDIHALLRLYRALYGDCIACLQLLLQFILDMFRHIRVDVYLPTIDQSKSQDESHAHFRNILALVVRQCFLYTLLWTISHAFCLQLCQPAN